MRVRVVFSKAPQLRWISHLDLLKALEKALRRSEVPMALSQGFNPRPKMSIASPLPVGSSGLAEVLDLELEDNVSLPELQKSINLHLPQGLCFTQIFEVPKKQASVMSLVTVSEYKISFLRKDINMEKLAAAVSCLKTEESLKIKIEQKGKIKEQDLKPGIFALDFLPEEESLYLVLQTGSDRFVRPNYMIDLLNEKMDDEFIKIEDYIIERQKILLKLT